MTASRSTWPRAAPHLRAPLGEQRGAALLIMLVVVLLGASALFVRELAGRSVTGQITNSASELAQAKEALLGFALTSDGSDPGRLGLLPCPDVDGSGGFAEGEAHGTACLARDHSVVGRFPWKTLGLMPRGGGSECFWYAVSGTWKQAGAATTELINPDSNGQFRVFVADGSTLLAGATPATRAVAVIVAPGERLPGQTRTAATSAAECGGNYNAANYLDADAVSGIDNSNLAAAADAIDDFINADASRDDLNDHVIFVTRSEIEERLGRRADVATKLRNLTEAVAKCVADYGMRNPGGAADRRLPWPAPVGLAQYRAEAFYDDTPVGWLSGRLADRVNDANALTSNAVARVLTNCSNATVPEWTAEMSSWWRNWKDHLFYAVAGSFRPDASPHSSCGTCLTVNGAGAWAAIVMFSGGRLQALSQVRDEPPTDPDTRSSIANYLEGRNAANHPATSGAGDYQSGPAGPTFNDILFCIDPALTVVPC
jgi:hypothetical protein